MMMMTMKAQKARMHKLEYESPQNKLMSGGNGEDGKWWWWWCWEGGFIAQSV